MKNVVYIGDDHNMVRNGLKSWLENHSMWRVEKDFATCRKLHQPPLFQNRCKKPRGTYSKVQIRGFLISTDKKAGK